MLGFCLGFIVSLKSFQLIVRAVKDNCDLYLRPPHSWPWSSEFFLAGQTSVTREFGSGVVLSCINDLGMTRPGIEPRSPSCEVNHLSLRHRGG